MRCFIFYFDLLVLYPYLLCSRHFPGVGLSTSGIKCLNYYEIFNKVGVTPYTIRAAGEGKRKSQEVIMSKQ